MNSARLGNAVRIVIAPDKFKGSLSAGEGARCLSTGIREARADAEAAVVPMADGGEGTLDAALANGYERREAVVHGPLGAPLRASFAMRGDEAVVELAVASGSRSSPRAAGMRSPRGRDGGSLGARSARGTDSLRPGLRRRPRAPGPGGRSACRIPQPSSILGHRQLLIQMQS